MQLTEEQKSQVIKKLKLNPACTNCGSTQPKFYGTNIVDLVSFNEIDGHVDTKNFGTMPCFTVTCSECGFINMFNLDILLSK